MTGPLARLKALSEMVSETELSRLRKAMETRQRIQAERAALLAPTLPSEDPGASPSDLAGAEAKWRVWRDARLQALGLQEAKAAADAEVRRKAAARAFGRAQVLRDLSEKPGRR